MAYIRKKKKTVSDALQKRSEDTIAYAIQTLRNSEISAYIRHAILFGSCARHEQNFSSDVDLLVELDASIDLAKAKKEIQQLITLVSPTDLSLPQVDLKIEIGPEWHDDNSFFHQQILKEGIEVWNGNTTLPVI